MRVEAFLKICEMLHITPDEILMQEAPVAQLRQAEIFKRLNSCNAKDRETALQLLTVFLKSLD